MFLDFALSSTFSQELVYLFQEMDVASAICFFMGLTFIIVEIFTPGFGFFGVSGIILSVIGIVLRATHGGNGNPVVQALLLLLIMIIVCIVAFVFMAVSSKKGWLSKTPFVMKESAVSTGVSEGTADYSCLVGKVGKTLCALRPSGIVDIDGVRYDVVAENEFIDADVQIKVMRVEGVRIVVAKIL